IVDIQLGEGMAHQLGPNSQVEAALRESPWSHIGRYWDLIDKLDVLRCLAAAGLRVPRFVEVPLGTDPAAVPELAAELGYPVVVKWRVATGGWGVAIAGDRTALLDAAARFGTAEPGIFLEEFI